MCLGDDMTGPPVDLDTAVAVDVPELTAAIAIDAFRRLDTRALSRFLSAMASGDLAPEASQVIGDTSALAAFLDTPEYESRAKKAEMGRLVWRRLADLLDGRVSEADIASGLSEGQRMSLLSLIQVVSQGQTFRGLRFPLHPGEAGWLHILAERLAPSPAPTSAPAEKHRPLAASHKEEALRQQLIPNSWSGASMINQVCQQAKIVLRKGQAAEILATMGPDWTPQDLGDVFDAARAFLAQVQAEDIAAGVMERYLNDGHGIPPAISGPAVRPLVKGRDWREVTDVCTVAELVDPLVPGLLDVLALKNGLVAMAAHPAAAKTRYFPEDLANEEVKRLLRSGRSRDALSALTRLRGERARQAVVHGMGTADAITIMGLASAGDGRPASLIRSLMPTMGMTFPAAAKAVALALGATAAQAPAFVETTAAGEKAARQREKDARSRRGDRSLLSVLEARTALDATPAEFRRWLDEGRIPVAQRVSFRRWGETLETTRHNPAEITKLKGEVQGWRDDRAQALAEAKKEAARARAALRPPEDPAVIRSRRLAAIIKSAGLEATPGASAVTFAIQVPIQKKGTWPAAIQVLIPPELEAAIAPEGKAAVGGVRKAAVLALKAAVEDVVPPVVERLEEVVAAWRERVETIAKGFPEEGSAAFQERLRRDVLNVLWGLKALPGAPDELVYRLSRLLEGALVATVNVHARGWGVEDLRVRSGLADYAAMFPEARAKKRRFVLHLGPTNSGKTHSAMDRLAAARSGAYLAPLRLMALEGAERLNGERNTPTSMVTGEEIHLVEGARHISATIEMADLSTNIDVAIIDEIQMISDRDRGWAWTQALVGIPADEIIMTGSVDALPYVTRIAGMTGDDMEVVMFERMTPLDALPKPVSLSAVQEGDAVIAFSRAEVLRLRDEITSKGIEVATIYGALGPEVRRTQAKRFRSGEAKVLVATDAIAMGLNLPIRRVILSALRKYDGVSVRPLTDSEIRQVAGRAGRYGIAERGEVGVMPELSPATVRDALAAIPRQPFDDRVPVMPPWPAVEAVSEALLTDDLQLILTHVTETLLKDAQDLRSSSLDDALAVADAIKDSGLPLRQRFRYLGCPIDGRDPSALVRLRQWGRMHAEGGQAPFPGWPAKGTPDTDRALAECEQAVKLLSAYLWLAMRYPSTYGDQEGAMQERDRLNGMIDAALRRRSLGRTCSRCGGRLRKGHQFPICDGCFHGNRRHYY